MIMDFDKYELSDELRAQLKSDYEADVAGLKNKNAELIEREKRAKEAKDTAEASVVEMTTAAEDAKVALAEKEGDIEKYKLAVSERDEKLATVQREFKEAEAGRLLDSAVNDFSAKLADDPAGKMYMQAQFKDAISVVDGEVKPND